MKHFFHPRTIICRSAGLLLGLFMGVAAVQATPAMNDYSVVPFFIEQATVNPNILIVLDNSGSMNEYVYSKDEDGSPSTYDHDKEYYGYFSSDYMYSHNGNKFVIDTSDGRWSGNFLNFVTMRRIDVLRKVVAGGKATSAVGTGSQTLWQEAGTGYGYKHVSHSWRIDNCSLSDVTPYSDGSWAFVIKDKGELEVHKHDSESWKLIDKLKVGVQKDVDYEPDCFDQVGDDKYRLAGVMQKFDDDAQWGNLWLVEDAKQKYEGGAISNPVGPVAQFSNMITDIRNQPSDAWTPLAEAYYVGMQHFRQLACEDGPGYKYAPGAADTNHDPFKTSEWCAKNFVLFLTDGMSTEDANIPDYLKDYSEEEGVDSIFMSDEDGGDYTDSSGRFDSGGTDFLKDVVYYARSNNLRDDVYGDTNLLSYFVYAFGEDENARNLLMEAARQGGFEDRDGDGKPDKEGEEWDKDEDGIPDTYFEAQEGDQLEQELERAIAAILARASSGTAASILSTNEEGEGSMVQAYFNPSVLTESGEATWLGYMQSLWIDSCGNMRDDSGDTPNQLDAHGDGADKIIEFVHDEENSNTEVRRYLTHPQYDQACASCQEEYWDSEADCATMTPTYETIKLDEVQPLMNAGRKLFEADPAERNIYTNVADDTSDGDVEQVDFTVENQELIAPHLGVNSESYDKYDMLGSSDEERQENLINFIRGDHIDSDTFRSRLVTVENQDGSTREDVWKLGDIVQSTPLTISGAIEQYDVYGPTSESRSYEKFRQSVRNRESVVYVGANDGMLHAFTHGLRTDAGFDEVDSTDLGTELWAYIPQSLLPHLKWLADPEYSHVYYVDLKPRVFDAHIDRDGDGTPEWGTFMMLGLRMGGKDIWTAYDFDGDGDMSNDDGTLETRDYSPTYTMIDITEPRKPEVMWERSYEGMGLSFAEPTVIKNQENWYAIFGSGPKESDRSRKADLQGWSDGEAGDGHIYVVDLATGKPVTNSDEDEYLFSTDKPKSFFNSPVSLDMDLNMNVDGIYIAETYDAATKYKLDKDETEWKSTLYKIHVPTGEDAEGNVNYAGPEEWERRTLFENDQALTAPVSLSTDNNDNLWVYFGTGRFMGAVENDEKGPIFDDRQSTEQQYMYGLKDPYYNKTRHGDSYYLDDDASLTLDRSTLFDSNSVAIGLQESEHGTQEMVFDADSSTLWEDPAGEGPDGQWDTLTNYVRKHTDGWYITLDLDTSDEESPESERVVSKPAVFGGVTLCSSYTPLYDPCLFGGYSNLYSVYYETGTAYKEHLLLDYDDGEWDYDGQTYTLVSKKSPSFVGAPPPSIGIHSGREGSSAFIQQSTGQILKLNMDTALKIRSGLSGWRTRW
ncbi:MAG: pilus assembly protein [Desulfosudaceae bacterium]